MKAMLVCDGDIKTQNSETLHRLLMKLFLQGNIEIKLFEVNRSNMKSCMGCTGCWIKTPGECVIGDSLNSINEAQQKKSSSWTACAQKCTIHYMKLIRTLKPILKYLLKINMQRPAHQYYYTEE